MNTWERGDTDGLQIPPLQGSNVCEDWIAAYKSRRFDARLKIFEWVKLNSLANSHAFIKFLKIRMEEDNGK